jgi:hypothetical protein
MKIWKYVKVSWYESQAPIHLNNRKKKGKSNILEDQKI